MSTTQPLPQFPYMKYLDNCMPWGKKKKKRKRKTIYMVPCRFKHCRKLVPQTSIGKRSAMCDDCFKYSLGGAFARYCR